jgi:competence protein ComEC
MIANHKGEIPFVILLIPFITSIILCVNFGAYTNTSILIILLILLCAVFILLNISYKWFHIYKVRWIGGVLIIPILFLFGWVSFALHSELSKPDYFSKTPSEYLVIRINNEPVLKNGYLRFTVEVVETLNKNKKTATSGTLLIALKDSAAGKLNYGDVLLIKSHYSTVDPPYNPAEFNYKQYLANQNIYYQQFLFAHQYAVMGRNAGNPIVAYALGLRRHLVNKLKVNMHDPDAIAVASGLLLGYRADLSGDILQTYSKTGAIYVLTVSGAQLAAIYFLLSFSLGFLSRHKYGKILRAIIIIGVLWYYALLTGLSPAICRAVVVVSMVVIGRTYNRYINTLNLLAASAFVLLLYDPFWITEVGFQLGYLAVAGLILLRPIVCKWLVFKNKMADKIWNLCAVSISAQVVTFPLTMFYFHQFPVYFLVSNLLVVIPVAIIMYSGILYLLLPKITVISSFLGYILENIILIMNNLLGLIKHVKFSNIDKIWINSIEYLLLYIIIISLFYFLYEKKVWLFKLFLACILLLSINVSLDRMNAQHTNSIAFLNLRKHAGIVMKNGSSAVVISDLADTDKNYKYSIQPYLDSSGISHTQVYTLKQDMRTDFGAKKYDLIQFRHIKLLLCNGQANYAQLNNTFKPDYVYISGNPYIAINILTKKQARQTLVINAGNSDHFISTLQRQADLNKIKYNVLKRNKSLLLVSN